MKSTMLAVLADRSAPGSVRITDRDVPEPAPHEALVKVEAIALNFAELPKNTTKHELFPEGTVMGVEAAGRIARAAADGSGPPEETQVLSFGVGGAWAQFRAVAASELTVLPEGVVPQQACTLPGAGLTALQGLRRMDAILGRQVLITGASGGVGRFAVQLAKLGGAGQVTALVSRPERGAGLEALGADEIVTSLTSDTGPFWGVLDGVGGDVFEAAYLRLAEGGTFVSIGHASGQPIVLRLPETYTPGVPNQGFTPGFASTRRIVGAVIGAGPQVAPGESPQTDLTFLLRLLATGRLDPQIAWKGSIEQIHEAFARLESRQINGKVVLNFPT